MTGLPDDLPIVEFVDAAAFAAWLEANHDSAPGMWMKVARVASGIPSITWEQAVPVALCWGWIDGQRRSLDETHFLQRWTPRRARSVWSAINAAHCERLIAEGLMQPAGLAQVEAARADGRWDAAYGSGANMQEPPELRAALDADPRAAAAYAALKAGERYSICWRIHTAKRAETKERRTRQFIEQLMADLNAG